MTQRTFCAQISEQIGDPIIGLAPHAGTWIMLENTDPWEWSAVLNNRLPDPVQRWYADTANNYATNHTIAIFIRQHLKPLDRIRCFVAITEEHREALYRFEFQHYEELLDLDLAAIRAGHPQYEHYRTDKPIYLICTNGKHDACCAKFGMPVQKEAARLCGDQVWHCSHIGHDHFAANLLSFPHGVFYSRVRVPDVAPLLEADRAGKLYLPKVRGRTKYTNVVQAAEILLRQRTQQVELTNLRLLEVTSTGENTTTVCMQARSGVTYTLVLHHRLHTITPPPCTCTNEARNYRFDFTLQSMHEER
ncbi:MAG: hypothetical protein J2P36_30040 [Ktedonobacteraceae bacterium]|nr:hypothetical protein [Ktedonobacteraceae bacterium]